MQTLIVVIIVALAVFYLVKSFLGKAKGKSGCGCGCGTCPTAGACDDEKNKDDRCET